MVLLTGGGFLCDGSRCMDPSVLCDEVGHCDDCTDEDQDTCFDAQCSHGIQLLNSTVLHVVHERLLVICSQITFAVDSLGCSACGKNICVTGLSTV